MTLAALQDNTTDRLPLDILALGAAERGPAIVQGPDGEAAVILSLDAYNRMRQGGKDESVPQDKGEMCDGAVVPAGSGLRAALSRGLRAMAF